LAGAFADQVLALLVVDDHVTGAQLFPVVGRAADGDRARAVETVAERGVTAGDAVDLELDQLLAEDRDDARKRAHPAQTAGRERGGRSEERRVGEGEG